MAKRRKEATGFGRRLRELRKARGLTQTDVGERLDMPQTVIARYEGGHTDPTWAMVLRIAKALGVKPNDFLEPGEA